MFQKNISSLSIKKKIPFYIFFELTKRCNLNCIHCYIVREKRQELSAGKIKEILDQLKEANSLIINFSGGEVFTRKDFFEIAQYARKQKFAIKIFTNATLINSHVAEKIRELKSLRVEVTIYSTNPKIHDYITGVSGSLQRSLNGLKELSKRKIPLRIKCPLLKQNVKDYKNIIKLSNNLNAKYQFDPVIFPKSNGKNEPLKFRIGTKELRRILSDPLLKDKDTRYFNPDIVCSAGHNSCTITSYGDVLPCILLPINLGNLKIKRFEEIWESSKKLQALRDIEWQNLKVCSSCRLSANCIRCPGLALLEDKNLLGPSQRACKITQIKSFLDN